MDYIFLLHVRDSFVWLFFCVLCAVVRWMLLKLMLLCLYLISLIFFYSSWIICLIRLKICWYNLDKCLCTDFVVFAMLFLGRYCYGWWLQTCCIYLWCCSFCFVCICKFSQILFTLLISLVFCFIWYQWASWMILLMFLCSLIYIHFMCNCWEDVSVVGDFLSITYVNFSVFLGFGCFCWLCRICRFWCV